MKPVFYTAKNLCLITRSAASKLFQILPILGRADDAKPSNVLLNSFSNILICLNNIKVKMVLSLLFFASVSCFGQITYFNSATNPADNSPLDLTTVAVTPPALMVAGDLVVMISHSYVTGNTQTLNATGGQTWTSETSLSTTNSTARIFWCRFNGTWGANPSVDFTTPTATGVVMHVFRPTTATNLWAVDVAQQTATFTAGSSPYKKTIGGQTTVNNSTVSLASWFSTDDNTWGTLVGAGWVVSGNAQYRINSTSDNSSTYAYNIRTSQGTAANVGKNQATLGGDAGQTSIITFYEYVPPTPPVNDSCSGSILLTSAVSCTNTAGTLLSATATAGLPSCGNAASPDVWYRFVAKSNYPTITLSSVGANLTTAAPLIQLFTGACGSLTQVSGACTASPLNTNINPGGAGLTIGATYYVRITTTNLSASVSAGSYNFNICITDPNVAASARVDFGKTYVNITDGVVGGTIDPGDVLEIRATLVIQKNLAGVAKGIDSIAYFDTLKAGRGFAFVPGSLTLRTNEGKVVTSFTDSNADSDPGWYKTLGAGTDTTIQMNMGIGASKTRGGSLLSTSRPSFYNATCIVMATFRVVVNAGYGTKINFGGGAFRYRDTETGLMLSNVFNSDSLIVYLSPGSCPDAVSPVNLIGDEYNGTFGAPPTGSSAAGTQNRAASPNTTYIDTTFGANAPQDYYYGVANNTSATNAIVQTAPKGDPSRVFTLWDITGDHTGAVNTGNTSKGNKPCDKSKPVSATNPCGYLLAINSAYKTDVAFEYNATGACTETFYEVSAWFKNLCYKCGCDSTGKGAGAGYIPTAPGDSSGVRPNIAMEIDGVDYYTTGELVYQGLGGTNTGSDTLNNWVKRSFVFKTSPTQTGFKLTFRNNAPGGGGNDWALDDISIRTCYPNMTYSPSSTPAVCAGHTLTITDTVRSFYNVYIYYKWQRSTDGGFTWVDIAGASGVAATVWNGDTYQYTNSYTLPPSATTLANNGDKYRMVVATNAINLAGSNCNYSDVTPVTIVINNCIDIDDDDDGIPDYVEFNDPVALQDANSNGIPNWNDPTYPGYVDNNSDGVNDNFDWGADSDNDGIPNYQDHDFWKVWVDINGDGVNDLSDKDLDGIPNQYDLDSDNDGIPDVVESYGVDTNGDGKIDNYVDIDNDGLSDNVDADKTGVRGSGIGLGAPDLDGDGIPNYLDTDSDNDGIPDVVESGGSDINNDGKIDGFVDVNRDGLHDGYINATALLKTGADINADGKADSYPNKNKDRDFRPNAYDLDSDGDGIADVIEAGFPDADFNGIVDGAIGANGWATVISSKPTLDLRFTDTDPYPDYLDIDSDDDGIPDNIEGQTTAGYKLPTLTDTDGDGIVDVYDNKPAVFGGSGILVYDHDGDGIPDYRDLDTDGDGQPDIIEGNDFNLNGILDDNVTLTGLDTDGDGLDNRFDSLNSVTNLKGTSYMMGISGSLVGDATPGSRCTVQKKTPGQPDRDWRYVGVVLPIQFLNFTAAEKNKTVTLNWKIIADKEVDRFEVERSLNNSNYIKVATVTDPVILNIQQSFEAADDVSSINNDVIYYRLKVTGKADEIKYSNVVVVRLQNLSTHVTIMPNPAKDFVSVNFYTDKEGPVSLRLIDNTGKIVFTNTYKALKGINTIQLDNLAMYKKAVYVLQLSLNDELITQKLILTW